jgi:DNA-binding transcriptional LysR family regulator
VDLNALQIFVEVGRLGSFTAAAKSLGLAKTSVSNKVQQLEKQLGNQLFNRTTRSVALTEAGAEIFIRAQEILARADDLQKLAESKIDEPQGLLRIAAPSAMMRGFLGNWSIEFRIRNPKVSMDLISSDQSLNFKEDQLDFAIRVGEHPASNLVSKKIFDFRMGIFASPELVQKFPTLKHPAELQNWPCIGFSVEGSIYPWIFQEDGMPLEIIPEPAMCFDDLALVKQAALEGLGVVHIGCQPAESGVMAGGLVPLLTDWWNPSEGCHLVYERHEHMASKNRAFIEFVERKTSEMAEYT